MTDVLEIPGKLEKRKKKRRSWRLAILGTTRPQGSRCWDLTTSSLLRQASRRYQEIYEKEELHSHFFIPCRGQCKVRLRPGRNNFFSKKRRIRPLAENPCQAVARKASRISLPGHGKRGELKIPIMPQQVRRPLMFFQHHWAPLQLFGIIRGSAFLLVFLFSVGL